MRNRHLIEGRKKLVMKHTESAELNTLRGFLSICFSCKKIRVEEGLWLAVNMSLLDHSKVKFSHGLCPDCMSRLYPGFEGEIN